MSSHQTIHHMYVCVCSIRSTIENLASMQYIYMYMYNVF